MAEKILVLCVLCLLVGYVLGMWDNYRRTKRLLEQGYLPKRGAKHSE